MGKRPELRGREDEGEKGRETAGVMFVRAVCDSGAATANGLKPLLSLSLLAPVYLRFVVSLSLKEQREN